MTKDELEELVHRTAMLSYRTGRLVTTGTWRCDPAFDIRIFSTIGDRGGVFIVQLSVLSEPTGDQYMTHKMTHILFRVPTCYGRPIYKDITEVFHCAPEYIHHDADYALRVLRSNAVLDDLANI